MFLIFIIICILIYDKLYLICLFIFFILVYLRWSNSIYLSTFIQKKKKN